MKPIARFAFFLREFPEMFLLAAIQNLPGSLGRRARYVFWKRRLGFLGNDVAIDPNVYLQNPAYISIGDNCWIDRGVIILAGPDQSTRKCRHVGGQELDPSGRVTIGNNVHIGPYCIVSGIESGVSIGHDCGLSSGVKVFAFSHHFRFDDAPEDRTCSFGPMVSQERQSMVSGPVILEDNVGVALNSIILPGVKIGRDSFVRANSILFDQAFEDNSMIGGSPAVRKGDRFKARSATG